MKRNDSIFSFRRKEVKVDENDIFSVKKKCEDKNDKVNENVLQVLENLIKNASLHF